MYIVYTMLGVTIGMLGVAIYSAILDYRANKRFSEVIEELTSSVDYYNEQTSRKLFNIIVQNENNTNHLEKEIKNAIRKVRKENKNENCR